MTKKSVYQEHTPLLVLQASNNTASKYIKQKLLEINEKNHHESFNFLNGKTKINSEYKGFRQ